MYEFESSVISYGNQTLVLVTHKLPSFESSVISYGNQTVAAPPAVITVV